MAAREAAPARGEEAAAAAARRRLRALERVREVEDSPRVLRDKCRRLARALRDAKHLVVSTRLSTASPNARPGRYRFTYVTYERPVHPVHYHT